MKKPCGAFLGYKDDIYETEIYCTKETVWACYHKHEEEKE